MVLQKRYFYPDWTETDIPKYESYYTWYAITNVMARILKIPLLAVIMLSS